MQFAIQSLSNVDSLRVKASPKEFHLSLSPAVIPCLLATDTMLPRARHLDCTVHFVSVTVHLPAWPAQLQLIL